MVAIRQRGTYAGSSCSLAYSYEPPDGPNISLTLRISAAVVLHNRIANKPQIVAPRSLLTDIKVP
ncbi:hypothetical protein [Pseudomonas sp. RIT-PI-r]|uniref:hypothetical protein n=1 Tax=Pseudomonas sp. RIT-PI-r TaxID=1699620 RepID=UPI0013791A74|nr:hypothetical protein [Pseudomonas sp. RIT-PI-r]